jgi:hypothetical protein
MSSDKTRCWVAIAICVLLGVTVDAGLTGQEMYMIEPALHILRTDDFV